MEVSTMERLFEWSSLAVMPCWALMILLPRARVTERVMRTPAAPALLALLYAVLVLPRMGALLPMLARPELAPVAALLGTAEGATIGWVHFLAFDLFVGRWIYLDSRERGVPALVMAPVLLLTILFGPLGFLAYLGVRATAGRSAGARSGVARGMAGALAVNRPLALVSAAMVPLFLLSVVGVVVDPTVITGAPAWLKPGKFAISLAIYGFTLLWL